MLHHRLICMERSASHKNLVEALLYLASFDLDIIGENGEENTRKEALDAGYKSNIEYYFECCCKSTGFEAVVETIEYWLSRDSYYQSHTIEAAYMNDFVVISLAAYSE